MKIVALAGDLVSKSKIREGLAGRAHQLTFISTVSQIREAELLVVDLDAAGEPLKFIAGARALAPALQIIAFGPHVNKELLDGALAAGATEAMPRSKFYGSVLIGL